MTAAQTKAARRKIKAKYGKYRKYGSIAESIARERQRAARENAMKATKVKK